METLTNVEMINKVLPKNIRYITPITADKIMECEYQRQAIEFLISSGTTCDIQKIGLFTPNWGDKEVNTYKVTLENSRHKYSFTFYDSIHNTEKNKSLTRDFYSVLACLNSYCPDNFDDFCADYGYEFKNESEYIRVKGIHLDCLEQANQLRKLFTLEQLEQLNEIN